MVSYVGLPYYLMFGLNPAPGSDADKTKSEQTAKPSDQSKKTLNKFGSMKRIKAKYLNNQVAPAATQEVTVPHRVQESAYRMFQANSCSNQNSDSK